MLEKTHKSEVKILRMDQYDVEHRNLYLRLCQESRILLLVYHRNKNQHRSTHWWKRLNMLKRNCSQVVNLLVNRKIIKKRELAKLYHLLQGFRKKQVSRTYYDFNNIIGLGQFVSLGVVLVGIVARIYATYGLLLELYDEQFQKAGFFPAVREEVTDEMRPEQLISTAGEELGEEIEQLPGQEQAPVQVEQSPAVKNRSKYKKSKKKKKSAIDSIFG